MSERIFGEQVIKKETVGGIECKLVKTHARPMEFVVRCKDCAHLETGTMNGEDVWCWCDHWEGEVEPNGFCYMGERRSGR